MVKTAALPAIARFGPRFRDLKRRTLDADFLRELQQHHPGVDLCGENGEYHTLVTDGPLFKQRVKISTGAPLWRDGYWHLAITGHALDYSGEKKEYERGEADRE